MSDLISRQAAIEAVNELTYPSDLMDVKRVLANMPSAEPTKHGRWVRKESKLCYWFECSECGYPPPLDKFKREWFSGYCPNCGAIMSEDEE